MLRSVATAHPKAISDPPPLALCTGFGDSALKIELRVAATLVSSSEAFKSTPDRSAALFRSEPPGHLDLVALQTAVELETGEA